MAKVLGFQTDGASSQFILGFGDDEQTVLLLQPGILETYIENYQLMPVDALTMIILDTVDDSVDVPPFLQDGMREVVEGILSKADSLEWLVDRDEVVSHIAVTPRTAPELSAQWREERIRNEAMASAHETRQMELAAAEYVDELPASVRSQPRDNGSIQVMDSLGLAIQFID